MLSEWLQQESIGARFVRARAGCKDADDKDDNVTGLWVRFELTTERKPIELRDQDLAHHEIGLDHASLLERLLAVRRQLDSMTSVA